MSIRKTRDGEYWIGDQRVAACDVLSILPDANILDGVSHFEVDGEISCMWDAECNQISMPQSVRDISDQIESLTEEIIAARDARLVAEYEEANPPLTDTDRKVAEYVEAERIAREKEILGAARAKAEVDGELDVCQALDLEINNM